MIEAVYIYEHEGVITQIDAPIAVVPRVGDEVVHWTIDRDGHGQMPFRTMCIEGEVGQVSHITRFKYTEPRVAPTELHEVAIHLRDVNVGVEERPASEEAGP